MRGASRRHGAAGIRRHGCDLLGSRPVEDVSHGKVKLGSGGWSSQVNREFSMYAGVVNGVGAGVVRSVVYGERLRRGGERRGGGSTSVL